MESLQSSGNQNWLRVDKSRTPLTVDPMRLFWLFFALAVLFLIPFLIWGDSMESVFTAAGAAGWLQGFGAWAWLAAIGLLLSDVFLPIPSTPVFAALGIVYGTTVGGLIGGVGFTGSATVAYSLCRAFGQKAALKILGETDLARGEKLFNNKGGWLVTVSRWLPLMPEVVSCMAGLTRMPFGKFLAAAACGSFPIAFAFAWMGSANADQPAIALGLSVVVAPVLWLIASRMMPKK